MVDIDWEIQSLTGESAWWWLNFIGHSIHRNSDHDTRVTQVVSWVDELVRELEPRVRERCGAGMDENILFARTMSLILTLWTSRIFRAKSYDPRRPSADCRRGLGGLVRYSQALVACLTDESLDREYFPKQEWESPFTRDDSKVEKPRPVFENKPEPDRKSKKPRRT